MSLDQASVSGLPTQPSACPPTRLLGGRWMKVSSWAVSRIRWGPRTSCSCWMPNLEAREIAGQREGTRITPTSIWPIGPALTQSPLPLSLPSPQQSQHRGVTLSTAPYPGPWPGSGLISLLIPSLGVPKLPGGFLR